MAFMVGVSALYLVAFYTFVSFVRGVDDRLGPHYTLPVVVAQATGTAALPVVTPSTTS